MFVRKIQTTVKTHSLQRNQKQLVQVAVPYKDGGEQQQLDASSSGCIALLARQEAPEMPFGSSPNFSLC